MDSIKKIYSDEFYTIIQSQKYPNIPGFYIINENTKAWYSSKESIDRLAIIEKTIREELLSFGAELVGIYREENENETKILLIPYYIPQLDKHNIPPDLYEPFIEKYLNSFDSLNNELNSELNRKIEKKLKKGLMKNE